MPQMPTTNAFVFPVSAPLSTLEPCRHGNPIYPMYTAWASWRGVIHTIMWSLLQIKGRGSLLVYVFGPKQVLFYFLVSGFDGNVGFRLHGYGYPTPERRIGTIFKLRLRLHAASGS